MTVLLTGTQVGQIGRLTSVGTLLVVLLVGSGCGGSYWYWSKPDVSKQQARQDGFECKLISRQQYIVGTGGMLMGGSEPNFEIWKECLEARGYTVRSEEERAQAQAIADSELKPPVKAFADIEREKRVKAELVQKEYQYLTAEKNRLDQQKVSLDSKPDSVQRREAIIAHNRQLVEYQKRLKGYEELRSK